MLDIEVFSGLLEVEDDDDGPDVELGRYMAWMGFECIEWNLHLTRNAL